MAVEFRLELAPFSAALLAELASLCGSVFGAPVRDLQWRLESMPDVSVFVASSDGRPVGFKAGYAMSQTRYYSWLGGVHPEFRKGGIAGRLMEMQHEWLSGRAYERVETAADQANLAMCQVNLRHGLVVCGLRHEPHRVQVLFSKRLQGGVDP